MKEECTNICTVCGRELSGKIDVFSGELYYACRAEEIASCKDLMQDAFEMGIMKAVHAQNDYGVIWYTGDYGQDSCIEFNEKNVEQIASHLQKYFKGIY